MIWVVAGAGLLLAALYLARGFASASPAAIARVLRTLGAATLAALAAVFLWRSNLLLAALSAAGAFWVFSGQLPPALQQFATPLFGGARRSGGQRSTVSSAALEMSLDHDTGEIGGRVLRGPFAGADLNDLMLDQLLELLAQLRTDDPDGARLLESYLDRVHGDVWRRTARAAPPSGHMSEDEALAVLGLSKGASAEEIREAHRRLMMQNHPDRGGSTFLAAQINAAKERLLGG